ncbi:MAG: hypothetical protein QXT67_08095 [Candidatus Bathyarchaeia archaeon]
MKAFALTEPFIIVILCILFPGRRTLMRLGKVFLGRRRQQRKERRGKMQTVSTLTKKKKRKK